MGFHIARSFNGALGRIVAGGLLGLALVSAGAASIAGLQAAPAKSVGKHTQILQGTAITGAVRSGEVNLATLPPATPAMLQASAAASARIPAPDLARQTAAQQDAYRQWAQAHPGALPKASGGPAPTSAGGPKTYGNGAKPVLLSKGAGLTRAEAGNWLTRPDPALAAAPGYVFEGVNNIMEVYSTTYAKKYGPWTPDQLFASVKQTSNDVFGFPQITYDAERSRYLIAWLEVSTIGSGNAEGYDYIDLAISNTSTPSPLTNFRVYQYAMTTTGADNVCWYPTLGYDYWGVYITCETDSASTGNFTGNNTMAFSINKMLSGTLQGVFYPTVYTDIGCPTACHPAARLSPTIEDGVPQAEWVTATDEGPDLIGISHIGDTSQNQTVCAITNTHALNSGGKPTYTCVNTTLPTPYAGTAPASQPGQTVYTDVGYKQVAYRNGQLYFAMPESVNCSGVTHDAIYWGAITPQLTTIAAKNPQWVNGVVDAYTQTGVFCYNDADAYTSALIADTEGDMTLVFTYSNSSSIYPSIGFTGRTAADAPGTMGQGTGSADVVLGSHASSNQTWGEHATCALPTNLVTRGIVYCVGQFGGTDTGSYGWDTQLFAIRMQ